MPSKWWPSKIQPSLIFWIVLVAIIVSTCNNTYVTNVLHIARIYCTRLALFNDIIFFSKRIFSWVSSLFLVAKFSGTHLFKHLSIRLHCKLQVPSKANNIISKGTYSCILGWCYYCSFQNIWTHTPFFCFSKRALMPGAFFSSLVLPCK